MCKCTNTVQLFAVSILQEGLSLSVLGAGPGVSHLVPGVCPVGQAQVAVEGRLGARGSQRLHDSLEVEFGTFDRLPCQMLPSWSWRFRIMWIRYPILFFLLSLSLFYSELKLGKTSIKKSNSGKKPTEGNESSVFSSCPDPTSGCSGSSLFPSLLTRFRKPERLLSPSLVGMRWSCFLTE